MVGRRFLAGPPSPVWAVVATFSFFGEHGSYHPTGKLPSKSFRPFSSRKKPTAATIEYGHGSYLLRPPHTMVLTSVHFWLFATKLAAVAFASPHIPRQAAIFRIARPQVHLPADVAPDLALVEAGARAAASVFGPLVDEAAVVVLGGGGAGRWQLRRRLLHSPLILIAPLAHANALGGRQLLSLHLGPGGDAVLAGDGLVGLLVELFDGVPTVDLGERRQSPTSALVDMLAFLHELISYLIMMIWRRQSPLYSKVKAEL